MTLRWRIHRCRILLSALAGGGVLVVGAARPETSVAAPTASETAPSPMIASSAVPGLTIEVDSAMSEAHRTLAWVEDQARVVLERRGTPLGSDDGIRLAVGGELLDYRIRIQLLRHERPLDEQPDELVCKCGTDEMLERVGEAIDAGAERLAAAERAEREAEAREALGSVVPGSERGGPEPSARRRISALGIAGAVTTGVGAGASVGGIVMAVLGSHRLSDSNGFSINWRPPGVATLVIGGAVLAAGTSMVVVDLTRCRRPDAPRRCERRSGKSKLELGPTFETRGGGVTLFGRF